ncbi:MAG TPA: TonB family protein [Steroidobacteraceae bacterium]
MKPYLPAFAALLLSVAAPALAQLGPIEPIIISGGKPGKALASIPDLAEDYVIPVEVTVAADGSVKSVVVSTPSGNEAADNTAVRFMMEKKFLPAIDTEGNPVEGQAQGTVEVRSKSINKVLKANMKPISTSNEVARVRKLTCKDFAWEIARLRNDGKSTMLHAEVMPWVSFRLYVTDKSVAGDIEKRLLDQWPQALATAEKQCKAAPDKNYLTDVLFPLLDAAAN